MYQDRRVVINTILDSANIKRQAPNSFENGANRHDRYKYQLRSVIACGKSRYRDLFK